LYRIIENVENILILRPIIKKIAVTEAEAKFVDRAKDIIFYYLELRRKMADMKLKTSVIFLFVSKRSVICQFNRIVS
jgi:hypothetical protein